MNAATKLGAYLAALAVVFAGALAVGNAVGPVGPAADPSPVVQTEDGHGGMDMDGDG
ncbi:hypothetical protein [Blastococcus sp. LR1]|uniref:hypothetical protein n=1 Tax=Blastococcus sp. LR1 TaxID=2877000 RepID=UPI001CCEEF0E|nr:hypothetical protein [Blastococcus sp. LR1]MCA0143810.1 hypothetical protein [Blastococcus sp. LR1]